jgi:hypothetical protein
MPTLNDAINEVEQVNDNLGDIKAALGTLNTHASNANDRIEANTAAVEEVREACEQNTAELSAINGRLLTGFANLSQGLDVLIDQANFTNKAFAHLLAQTDTVICLLDKSARSLCQIWTLVDIQTRLLHSIREDTNAVREMLETVHPEAKLERDRRRALQHDIELCCPRRPEPPACEYEPCPTPRRFDEDIPDAVFEPLPLPTPEG